MREQDVSRAARLAETIAGGFYSSRLDLSARGIETIDPWSQMPEVASAKRLRASGVSDRRLRLYLTFNTAMDRARDSNRLWRNAFAMFKACPSLYEPDVVSRVPLDTLREVLAHFRVSQRHGPDSEAWRDIARSLASNEGPVYRVIEEGVGDADEMLRDLRSRSGGGESLPIAQRAKDWPTMGAHYGESRRGCHQWN